MRFYRSVLLVSTFAWFMIGLHVPALHQVTHHSTTPSLTFVAAISLLSATGIAGLWMLLRVPMRISREDT